MSRTQVAATTSPHSTRLAMRRGFGSTWKPSLRCTTTRCSSGPRGAANTGACSPGLNTLRTLGAHFPDATALAADDSPFLAGIRDFVEAEGLGHVQVLDALPALRRVEREGRRAFYLHDPHLNECGQDALARLVLATALGSRSRTEQQRLQHPLQRGGQRTDQLAEQEPGIPQSVGDVPSIG